MNYFFALAIISSLSLSAVNTNVDTSVSAVGGSDGMTAVIITTETSVEQVEERALDTYFTATIDSIDGEEMLVSVAPSGQHLVGDKAYVTWKDASEFEVSDEIVIYYDIVKESYPVQIDALYIELSE